MRRAFLAFWLATGLLGRASLQGLNIDEAVALAVESSPEVIAAVEAARDAAEAVGSPFELEKSRLSVTGSYQPATESGGREGSTPTSESEDPYSAAADLSLPVLPQLSLSGSLDSAGKGSASVTLAPFAPWNFYTVEQGAYRQTLAELEAKVAETGARAERLVLDYLVARSRVEHAKEAAVLAEESYEAVRRSYDLGEVGFDDVRDAQQEVSDARRQHLSAQKTLVAAGKTLSLLLGPTVIRSHTGSDGSIRIEPLTTEEVLRRAGERRLVVDRLDPARSSSTALERSRIELETLKRQERETWLWRPALTVKGGMSFPDSRLTASISLSFSPSDLNDDRLGDLASAIEDTADAIATEQFTLALDVEAARRSVEISREALDAALLDRERARVLAEEAEILLEHGERTVIEAHQARLSLESAEIGVFQAAADLLSAQSDYLLYFERE